MIKIIKEDSKVYYRGTVKGNTKRISTGNPVWDNNLFASKIIDYARAYGDNIEIIKPKPNARIAVEGTPEFKQVFGRPKKNQSLLDWYSSVVTKAKSLEYDIVEFERQGDVGTVIINKNSVIRNWKEK